MQTLQSAGRDTQSLVQGGESSSRLPRLLVKRSLPVLELTASPRPNPFTLNPNLLPALYGKFVEEFCTGEEGGDWEKRIPTACIGGAALNGRSTFGGLFKDLVSGEET